MEVKIKKLESVPINRTPVSIQVNDNDGKLLGTLHITSSSVTWSKGKKLKENGIEKPWREFIDLMQAEEAWS